jgi:hypothetical protein
MTGKLCFLLHGSTTTKGSNMSKYLKVTRTGESQFVMTVEMESGHKEDWTYQREEHNGCVSFTMVNREEL